MRVSRKPASRRALNWPIYDLGDRFGGKFGLRKGLKSRKKINYIKDSNERTKK